jgi:uncharacterized membrane protein YfcA
VTPLEAGAIIAAGMAAGTINTIVGSGSLITFPTLLALGYPPLVANVTNGIGLVPGSVAGTWGYRHELAGQGRRALGLAGIALVGGLTGGVLLLALPASSFERVVPYLILLAAGLVAVQPQLARFVMRRRANGGSDGLIFRVLIFAVGLYGGYFGAAQGVILIALLGIFIGEHLQRMNALKNLLAGLQSGIAALLFVFVAPVAWEAVVLLAIGAAIGGVIGARVGRRLPPTALRAVIVVVGTVVGVRMLLG